MLFAINSPSNERIYEQRISKDNEKNSPQEGVMVHFEFLRVVSSHEKSTEKIILVKKQVGSKRPDFSTNRGHSM